RGVQVQPAAVHQDQRGYRGERLAHRVRLHDAVRPPLPAAPRVRAATPQADHPPPALPRPHPPPRAGQPLQTPPRRTPPRPAPPGTYRPPPRTRAPPARPTARPQSAQPGSGWPHRSAWPAPAGRSRPGTPLTSKNMNNRKNASPPSNEPKSTPPNYAPSLPMSRPSADAWRSLPTSAPNASSSAEP